MRILCPTPSTLVRSPITITVPLAEFRIAAVHKTTLDIFGVVGAGAAPVSTAIVVTCLSVYTDTTVSVRIGPVEVLTMAVEGCVGGGCEEGYGDADERINVHGGQRLGSFKVRGDGGVFDGDSSCCPR